MPTLCLQAVCMHLSQGDIPLCIAFGDRLTAWTTVAYNVLNWTTSQLRDLGF